MPILKSLFRSRDKPQNSLNSSRYSFFFGGTTSGKPVNENTAMQMTAVYSCVRILSETLAGLPLHIYRYSEDGKEKDLAHPLYRLLHDEPNPEMTSFVFRETLMGHLLLWGNAYAQVIRNARGEVVALYPLMPNRMTVDRDKNGSLYYTYLRSEGDSPSLGKSSQVILAPSDVLHIPGLGFDGLVGYSPIAMAKNAIGLAIATEEYGAKFFANGAAPGGVLEHPGTIKDPQKVKESWNSAYQGSSNAHRVAVLEEGMKYQALVEDLRKPPEERRKVLPERHLLTLEQIAAELPSETCRGTPESMLYELEDALDTFFFRWSVCLSHNKDYFLAKKHNPKVNKLAQNGLAYLNRILKGEIPL